VVILGNILSQKHELSDYKYQPFHGPH